MGILINRFDGGEVDFFSARDLGDNEFQTFDNMSMEHVLKAVKTLTTSQATATTPNRGYILPGQGLFQYRAEWDNESTPRQVSTAYIVLAVINATAGAEEINIYRANMKTYIGGFDAAFIDETAAKGGWERGTSNRLVNGSSNVSFTNSTKIISGVANLENYEVGEVIRVYNTTNNNGYFTVREKAPAANSVTVQETLVDESNTSARIYPIPCISYYAVNGGLRISNGNFYDDHKSQWYGLIKRDFWGQGVTYGSNSGRYSQPPMKEAHSAWYLKPQELVAPTMIVGGKIGGSTTAANEIAIHRGTFLPSGWPDKAAGAEWNARDRVTCTYVYDFVQESELGKAANGEIGLEMGSYATTNLDNARSFMVEAYTGTSNASWNRRITAIKLYYKFYDDPDWYEVAYLDVNNGWKKSSLIFEDENTGYWIPIISSISDTGTSDNPGGSGTTFESDAHGLSGGESLYIGRSDYIEPDVMFTKAASVVTDTITLPVAAVNSEGLETTYDAQNWCAGPISTVAVATFYIPFTGEKDFTYFTNTGRSSKLKVPAIRWRAADTDGSKVLIGNIDTLDDNQQTIRERTRVMESPDGMPDVFTIVRSKDVGTNTADEIKAIKYYNGYWWVMMERNIVVLQPGTLKTVAQYNGVGCLWGGGNAVTPFGLCVADKSAITLLPGNKELTQKKRKTYRDTNVLGSGNTTLVFHEPAMGYSLNGRSLYFMPDTSGGDEDVWVYSFDNDGWTKIDLVPDALYTGYSNFVLLAKNNEPDIALNVTDIALVHRLNGTANGAAVTATILSKEYDLGHSHAQKTLRNGFLVYKSSTISYIKVYLDGATTAYKTIEIAISTDWSTIEVSLNVTAKTFTFGFEGNGNTYEIDEFSIPDNEITILA